MSGIAFSGVYEHHAMAFTAKRGGEGLVAGSPGPSFRREDHDGIVVQGAHQIRFEFAGNDDAGAERKAGAKTFELLFEEAEMHGRVRHGKWNDLDFKKTDLRVEPRSQPFRGS